MNNLRQFEKEIEQIKDIYQLDLIDLKRFDDLIELLKNDGMENEEIIEFLDNLLRLGDDGAINLANNINSELYCDDDMIMNYDEMDYDYGYNVYQLLIKLDVETDEFYIDENNHITFYNIFDAGEIARKRIGYYLTYFNDEIDNIRYILGELKCVI